MFSSHCHRNKMFFLSGISRRGWSKSGSLIRRPIFELGPHKCSLGGDHLLRGTIKRQKWAEREAKTNQLLVLNITAEEGVDAALAFVEAVPSASAFVFAVAGVAGSGLAAYGEVAACGEGVHGEVAGGNPSFIAGRFLQIHSLCGIGLFGQYASKTFVFPSHQRPRVFPAAWQAV